MLVFPLFKEEALLSEVKPLVKVKMEELRHEFHTPKQLENWIQKS